MIGLWSVRWKVDEGCERSFRKDTQVMAKVSDFEGLEDWLAARLGRDLDGGIQAVAEDAHPEPLLAYRIGDRSMMRVMRELTSEIAPIVEGLSHEELFSVFGTYELGRVTLAHGVSVWGPTYYYFGNRDTFRASDDKRVRRLSSEEVTRVADKEVFWHCGWEEAVANFGVIEEDHLLALTCVHAIGNPVYEIDVDVVPGTGQRGLGSAVMSAACRWILENDGLILARTAPWNVPSARLMRAMGLQYVLCDLEGRRSDFRVPPQPLGKPRPDAVIYDHYPAWAHNQEIVRR
jgi:RimJ/RimL family protein N-acetyltransferase